MQRKYLQNIIIAQLLMFVVVGTPGYGISEYERCTIEEIKVMERNAQAAITRDISNLESDLQQQLSMFSEHNRRAGELRNQLDVLRKQLASSGGTNRQIQAQIATVENALTFSQNSIEAALTAIARIRAQLAELQEKLSNLIKSFNKFRTDTIGWQPADKLTRACQIVENPNREPRWEPPNHPVHTPNVPRRNRISTVVNAVAFIGGVAISLWPSDSASAGDFNAAPVLYPISNQPPYPRTPPNNPPPNTNPIVPPSNDPPACPPEQPVPVCPVSTPTPEPTPAETPKPSPTPGNNNPS